MPSNSDVFQQMSDYLQNQKQAQEMAPIRTAEALAKVPAPAEGQMGQAEAALRAGVDGATYGIGDSVKAGINTAIKIAQGQSADYATEEAAERAKTKLAGQQWPLTAATAGIAGSLATMPLAPEVGILKGAGAIAKIGKAALAGAGIAAADAAGHASGSLIDRAETGLSAAPAGGVVGGGLGTAGAAIGRVLNPTLAGEQVIRQLGHSPGAVAGLEEAFKGKGGLAAAGKALQEQGYVAPTKSIQETAAHLDRDLQATGESIGGLFQHVDAQLGGPRLNADKVLSRIQSAVADSVKENPGIATEIQNAAQAPIKNYIKSFITPAVAQNQKALVGFSDLQNFRTTLNGAYEQKSPAVSEALTKVERTVQDMIHSTLAKTNPEAHKVLTQLDSRYNFLANAGKLANTGVTQAEGKANSIASHGLQAGIIGGATAALTGHAEGIPAGVALAAASQGLARPIANHIHTAPGAIRQAAANSSIAQGVQNTSSTLANPALAEMFRQNQ